MDVRIIGGGLAGLVTGLELLAGRHGGDHQVTIHERAPRPYTTLCGEGLSHATLSRFTAFDSLPYVAQEFRGASWAFPGDVRVEIDQRCYTMARERWIPAMAEAFTKLGGVYHAGVKVGPEDVERLAREADLVVGADGPGSVVRRHVGGSHETMLGIQYRVSFDGYATDRLEFYTDKRFSPEYAWIFPRGNQHNVGILAEGDGKDWERLDAFMEERGVRGRVLKREAYPIGFAGTKVQAGNVVLVGDAAGLTNPVTKGGMAAILHAAEILAECVAQGEVGRYGERIAAHPLSDPSYAKAVAILRRWTNRDFEKIARFSPRVLKTGRVPMRWRYAPPLLATALANPGKAPALAILARAMRLSLRYSW